tara:strand:- start:9707 stop:10051 length:345 start_codon:yes stop_codon:yes gene_type:complete
MWFAHNEGWLSIVMHRTRPEHLLVRARKYEHIESLFPHEDIYTDFNADYPYRADVLREDVATTIANELMEIDYDNFKNSVNDTSLRIAYGKVWEDMYKYGYEYREGTDYKGGLI